MTDVNDQHMQALQNIQTQINALGQGLMSLRDLPGAVHENAKRLESLEHQVQAITLDQLDDLVAGLQYASLKTERAVLVSSKWKPSFLLGVLIITATMFLAYYLGLRQGVPEKRALINWAEQFRTPNQRDLAVWTLREEEAASIASKSDLGDLKWINSAEAAYSRKFFKINAYLLSGDCPRKHLTITEINGRNLCTVWKVEP